MPQSRLHVYIGRAEHPHTRMFVRCVLAARNPREIAEIMGISRVEAQAHWLEKGKPQEIRVARQNPGVPCYGTNGLLPADTYQPIPPGAELTSAASPPPAATKCPGHRRHWFTAYGYPGTRSPYCVRCGAPNPYWKPPEREATGR